MTLQAPQLTPAARAALATKPDEEVVAATQRLEALAAFMEPGSQDRWVVENAAALLEQFMTAALAVAPEGEGPSLEEVEELCEEHCFNVEGYESIECLQGLINDALARWGRPTTPPAPPEGEVGRLVTLFAVGADCSGGARLSPDQCHRTATLLEQQAAELARLRSAPAVVPQPAPLAGLTAAQLQVLRDVLWSAQDEGPPGEGWASRQLRELREIVDAWQSAPPAVVPIPVSERPILKSNPFNDAEGRCWCGTAAFADSIGDLTVEHPPSWELRMPQPEDDCVVAAHALPLPAPQGGEVEA